MEDTMTAKDKRGSHTNLQRAKKLIDMHKIFRSSKVETVLFVQMLQTTPGETT
jgi:hypothetical protein